MPASHKRRKSASAPGGTKTRGRTANTHPPIPRATGAIRRAGAPIDRSGSSYKPS